MNVYKQNWSFTWIIYNMIAISFKKIPPKKDNKDTKTQAVTESVRRWETEEKIIKKSKAKHIKKSI